MSSHGGNIYDLIHPGEAIDFSSSINPFGPPGFALAAARDSLELIKKYPDARESGIRGAFASWLGVDPDGLVFGNGASEMIYAAMAAIAPRRALVMSPTFSEYASCASRLGIEVVEIPSIAHNDFAFDTDAIMRIFSRGDLLTICQPNNPTGTAWSESELRMISAMCRERGGYMMADECFINLTSPRAPSCIGMVGDENVVVLRAVTKDFSAPGLRVGFTISCPAAAAAIRSRIQPWPLNCVGEAYAVACAREPEPFLSESASRVSALRERMSRALRGLGYSPYPSDVNFMLVRGGSESAEEIYSFLLERSILVRRCSDFSQLDGRFFRLAVRPEDDQDKLFSRLAMMRHR
ncbi:MAG: aminotransferase class I/II-fold pyridoxal phosphate-dependent enzyme [Synergistaceae bacterium]|jgi:threonine-phosphate decarboxylase|nr:aminotransferase class I/II-fold pyridoxal phosphate-dependent enzyme [Synergistaceae bacterium]